MDRKGEQRERNRTYHTRWLAKVRSDPERWARFLRHQREYRRRFNQAHPDRQREYERKRTEKWWARLCKVYGNGCECCGETNKMFLTLAHRNNDGAKERKEIGRHPRVMMKRAIDLADPTRYMILCFNCNCGAARNDGVCPHKGVK